MQKSKIRHPFCDCSLNKIINKYSSFEEAMRNEEDFPEILIYIKKILNSFFRTTTVNQSK